MSETTPVVPRRRRRPNKPAQLGATVGLMIGIVAFNVVAPSYFPPPEGGGFNWMFVVWSVLIGGISAGLGAIIGSIVGSASKNK